MATTHTTQESTADVQQTSEHFLSRKLGKLRNWFVVAANIVGNAVLFAGVFLSAGLAAAYLAALIPGPAGAAVFFTVGLGLIGAAPEIALWVRSVVFDALEQTRR